MIFTARNEVGARLYFHRRLWFCSRGGVSASVHALMPPPRPGRHPPPQCMLGDTVNERAERILLECNLVCGSFHTYTWALPGYLHLYFRIDRSWSKYRSRCRCLINPSFDNRTGVHGPTNGLFIYKFLIEDIFCQYSFENNLVWFCPADHLTRWYPEWWSRIRRQ